MGLLVACKNEEDPIKNEGARVVTTSFIYFSDAQGQLTPKSVMESCQNLRDIRTFFVEYSDLGHAFTENMKVMSIH